MVVQGRWGKEGGLVDQGGVDSVVADVQAYLGRFVAIIKIASTVVVADRCL
jgi:hypothetical protein